MVTDTRTTPIRTETVRPIVATERTDTTNKAAIWIVLAVIAFAALGYAFFHYSNPAMDSSMSNAPLSTQTTPMNDTTTTTPVGNGAVMNNDTPTSPNTGTPTGTSEMTSEPSAATGTDTTNTNSTAQ